MCTVFNKRDVFKDKIEPLISALKKACNEEKMPMFITVCVKNNKSETEYENDMISPAITETKLNDDVFPNLVNVMNGFDTVMKQEMPEIEFF